MTGSTVDSSATTRYAVTLGVIEGFYGRQWSSEEREAVMAELASQGYRDFVFAPKSERRLRSEWRQPWESAALDALQQQASHARSSGLRWGVGFSPLGLVQLDKAEKAALAVKLEQLQSCSPDVFCLLFDDMRGDTPGLARRQLEVADWVAARLPADCKLLFCPSYYTTDPVLESVFGAMPKSYWHELGVALDPRISFFWTGPRVCSEHFERSDFEMISTKMRRKPTLWDNYPVNDSRKLCRYLRVMPFSNREPWLADWLEGHYANPMNQPYLSLLPLSTLPPVYQKESEADLKQRQQRHWDRALEKLARNPAILREGASKFATDGLDQLTPSDTDYFLNQARAHPEPVYKELEQWLSGAYAFDEACLTE